MQTLLLVGGLALAAEQCFGPAERRAIERLAALSTGPGNASTVASAFMRQCQPARWTARDAQWYLQYNWQAGAPFGRAKALLRGECESTDEEEGRHILDRLQCASVA